MPRFYAGSTLKVTYKPNLDMEIERHSVRRTGKEEKGDASGQGG